MNKVKILATIVLAIFSFTMAPLSVSASNDGHFKKEKEKNHYVQQCTDIPTLNAELLTAKAALPAAQIALDTAQDAYDNAPKNPKATKKALKNALKDAEQLVWNIEGEIKWINKELKKLDKFCYGQKPNHHNEHSWGKKFSNFVSGWFHFGKADAK
jgi:hypothetical protein